MSEEQTNSGAGDGASNLLMIVVGAHLRAEVADRPLAYRLRERIHAWLEKHAAGLNVPLSPVVCTDVWYLNQEALQQRPTLSLGGPGINALSRYYFQKLPASITGNEQVVIQLDPEMTDLRVCVWGMNHEQTVVALEQFVHDHLDSFLRAVVTQVEPQDE
ncbi:MAG: hypothetical protein NTW19_16080 [Planctomycetota bacterium]|nr:hypothetical protein [Planctomycetota bacterium]